MLSTQDVQRSLTRNWLWTGVNCIESLPEITMFEGARPSDVAQTCSVERASASLPIETSVQDRTHDRVGLMYSLAY